MRLKRNHPWNPGYALPASIYAEGERANVTRQAPRGTYDDPEVSDAWSGHYALPGSVRAERPGQEVHVTPWARRGTGLRNTNNEFAQSALEGLGDAAPPRKMATKDPRLARGTAATGGKIVLGGTSDPIAGFGRDGAAAVMRAVNSVPAGERIKVLRAMLNAIDPAMWTAVDKKMAAAKAKGTPPKGGLPKAVAAALANHFAKQVVQVGRSGRVPVSGVLGLANYEEDVAHAHQSLSGFLAAEGYGDLGWSIGGAISSIGGAVKGAANAVGSGVKTAVKATGSGIKTAVVATGHGIKTAAVATGHAIKTGATAVYNVAKDGLNALGDLACKAANSGVLTLAAQGAGTALGGPAAGAAGGQGAELVKGLCAKGGASGIIPQQPASGDAGMSTTTMLLVGGAGLGLLFLLVK
jgi:hypothetical protein